MKSPLPGQTVSLGTRVFTGNDQLVFATASGDHNPMHMEPVAARRTLAGAPVVHGIHLLLWLLDRAVAGCSGLPPAATVKVQFKKMVFLGDEVEALLVARNETSLRMEAMSDGDTAVRVSMTFGAPRPEPIALPASQIRPIPSSPLELTWEEVAASSGCLAFAPGSANLLPLFPNLVRYLGENRVIALACTSSLVGMVVPGLHSLYKSLDFHIKEPDHIASGLAYQVQSVDDRFYLIRQAFSGGGIFGSIDCPYRRPPTRQASIHTVAQHVPPHVYRGATALVIGGSRGLGELTAKIIAAGGGKVIVTYASGKADAESVCAEITAWGGECRTAPYDALLNAEAQLAALPDVPTHYYYFATPSIFGRKGRVFSMSRFDEFNTIYVDAFDRLIRAASLLRPEGIRAFYPSSVAVENRPPGMTAYAMSKAAGEILCSDINAYMDKVEIIVSRLPRLPTDQTATLQEVKTEDPLTVMLPLVQKVQFPETRA